MEHQINDFNDGDMGVIRVGHDSRNKMERNGASKLKRGIYAMVQVIGHPEYGKNNPDEYSYGNVNQNASRATVKVHFLKDTCQKPLLLTELAIDEIIKKDKFLLNGFLASSMPLQKETFDRINELWNKERE